MARKDNYHVVTLAGVTVTDAAEVDSGETNIVGEVVGILVDGTNLTAAADLDILAVYLDVDGNEVEQTAANIDDVGGAMATFKPREMADGPDGADEDFDGGDGTQGAPVPFPLMGCFLRAEIANAGDAEEFSVRVLIRS